MKYLILFACTLVNKGITNIQLVSDETVNILGYNSNGYIE